MSGKTVLVFRTHAIQRMFERAITKEDVRRVLAKGKAIVTIQPETLKVFSAAQIIRG